MYKKLISKFVIFYMAFPANHVFCQFNLDIHALQSSQGAQGNAISLLLPMYNGGNATNGFLPSVIPLNFIDTFDFVSYNSAIGVTPLTSIPVSKRSTKVIGGGIILTSNSKPASRGICWSNIPNPTMHDNVSPMTFSENEYFAYEICCLIPGKTYYCRTFYADDTDTIYGNTVSFSTENCFDGVCTYPGLGVYDINNQYYESVVLGNGQEWMTSNLNVDKFSNGDPIQGLNSPNWESTTSPAYANTFGVNDPIYQNEYGKYYNWYAVSDMRNVCPAGWHVPTVADWTALSSYLGGSSIAGGRMKFIGTSNSNCSAWQNGQSKWNAPNTNASNLSGFSAQAGGWINGASQTAYGTKGNFWSSNIDPVNQTLSITFFISNIYGNLYQTSVPKNSGLNIRCLKD
jgi:uncharacterized protein (TIGR02145 family)